MASNKKDNKLDESASDAPKEIFYHGSVFTWRDGLGWRMIHLKIPQEIALKYATEKPTDNTPAVQINKAGRYAMKLFNGTRDRIC